MICTLRDELSRSCREIMKLETDPSSTQQVKIVKYSWHSDWIFHRHRRILQCCCTTHVYAECLFFRRFSHYRVLHINQSFVEIDFEVTNPRPSFLFLCKKCIILEKLTLKQKKSSAGLKRRRSDGDISR